MLTAKTRSFPGADTGIDHELVTFRPHLKKVSKQGHIRGNFDLEKLKDADVVEDFHVKLVGDRGEIWLR